MQQRKVVGIGIAIVDTEGVVSSIGWQLRIVALLILIFIVVEASSNIAQHEGSVHDS